MIPLIRERLADEKARHGIRTFDDLLLTVRQACAIQVEAIRFGNSRAFSGGNYR